MSQEPKPSWAEAHLRREALLFKNEEEGDGKLMGERKNWGWFEWPGVIQTQSSGLGLYFKTMNYFLIVTFLMSIVGVGPLVANYFADEFKDTYTLVETGTEPRECDRGYEVGGRILETSLGNWCGRRQDMSQSFAGVFDCAAQCIYPSTSSTEFSSLGWCLEEGQSLVADSTCVFRAPCPTSCSSSENDLKSVEERIGCCNCCDLQLDSEKLGDTPLWQAWLWCILGTFVWVVWIRLLKRMQDKASAQVNAKNVTTADFSVWMSNLPAKANSDDELRKYAEHYGEVVAAFHVRRMGNVLNLNNQVEEAERHLAETKALSQEPGGFFDMMYRRYICGLFAGADAAAEKLEDKIKELKEQLDAKEEKDLAEFKPTGTAIVVFNYSRHKRNMTEDHTRSNTYADFLLTPAMHRQFDVLTRGWFSGAPRFRVEDNSGILINGGSQIDSETTCFNRPPGHFIRVQRAPEPDEIWWENTVSRFPHIWLRRGLSWALYLALIAVSCVIQFWITRVAEEEREDRLSAGRGASATDSSSTGNTIEENFALAAASVTDSASLFWYSLLQGLVVTLLNIIVLPVVSSLATYERHQTTTSYLTVMVFKLTVFYFLNSFAVPIIAYSVAAKRESWFTPGGVAESAFYIQLVNTFLPDLLTVVDIPRMFAHHVLSRFARTQDYLNAAIQPRIFDIPLRFSNAIKTVALGVLWAPALPVSPLLSLAGLLISYWADQFLALHRCRKPQSFDVEALNVVNTSVLDALPLVQMLIIYFVYFADDGNSQVIAAFALGVILWGIAFLAPIDFIFASTRNKNVEPDGAERYSFNALWGLGMTGTSTNHSFGSVLGSRRQKEIDDIRVWDDNKLLHPKFYYPTLPTDHLSSDWADLVTSKFEISASGPNHEARLRGQEERFGAPNGTKDPPNIKNIKKSIKARQNSFLRTPLFPEPDYGYGGNAQSPATVATSDPQPQRPSMTSPLYGVSGGNLSHLQRPGYFQSPYLAMLQASANIPVYARPHAPPTTAAYPSVNTPTVVDVPQASAPPLPTDFPQTAYPPIPAPNDSSLPAYPPVQPPGYYPGQSNSHNPNFPKT